MSRTAADPPLNPSTADSASGYHLAMAAPAAPSGTWTEVFSTSLRLGLSSFGGPIAHLGYFHREFVQHRGWLDETQFARLVALCQFLPGPASSQLGFAVGLLRAGWRGAFAAFVAFSLPSILLMVAFAHTAPGLSGVHGAALVHGLKLVAVAIVADSARRMAMQLTPDTPRALIAIGVAIGVITLGGSIAQLAALLAGALLGLLLCREGRDGRTAAPAPFALPYGVRLGTTLLGVFALLLASAAVVAHLQTPTLLAIAAAFYRAGALVFGGGHVVLPLLEESLVTPGWLTQDQFLSGYGAAQALPGPMFAVAGYLGAVANPSSFGLAGALVAVLAIFAPGLMLVAGALPWWHRIAGIRSAAAALAGVNAAVVGLLVAALYDPLWGSAVHSLVDFAIAAAGFVLLASNRASALWVIAWCVGAAWSAAMLA